MRGGIRASGGPCGRPCICPDIPRFSMEGSGPGGIRSVVVGSVWQAGEGWRCAHFYLHAPVCR